MTAPDPDGRSRTVQADLARIDAALAAGRATDDDAAGRALQSFALALRAVAPRAPQALVDALEERFGPAASTAVLTLSVRTPEDALVARRRARDLAALLQFTPAEQIGLSTAVWEVVRLAGRGEVELAVVDAPPSLAMRVTVSDLEPSVLAARGDAPPLDLAALRPLVDRVEARECAGRAVVRLSAAAGPDAFVPSVDELELVLASLTRHETVGGGAPGILDELRQQNFELLTALATLREREQELALLHAQLGDANYAISTLHADIDDANRAISALYGQLEAQTAEPRATVVRLSDVQVRELFATLRAIVTPIRHPGVELRFAEAHEVPVLRTDAFKLSQILRNFIGNALKFTEAGFVRVSARTVDDGEAVRFEVSDTGPGLSIEEQGRAFEEFVQLGSEDLGQARGTGLGLPLTRRLAAILGGEVAVRSTPGQGATFSVTVPVHYRGDVDVVDND